MTVRVCHECGQVIDDARARVTLGELVVDRVLRFVTWQGEPVAITPWLLDITATLALRGGRPVRFAEFIMTIDADSDVRVAICRLRAAFRAVDPDFDRIENLKGIGYRWRVE